MDTNVIGCVFHLLTCVGFAAIGIVMLLPFFISIEQSIFSVLCISTAAIVTLSSFIVPAQIMVYQDGFLDATELFMVCAT